jgi:hypothetical protein
MTTVTEARRPRTTSRPTGRAVAHHPSVELMSEAVVATYIRDLSTRRPIRRARQASQAGAARSNAGCSPR